MNRRARAWPDHFSVAEDSPAGQWAQGRLARSLLWASSGGLALVLVLLLPGCDSLDNPVAPTGSTLFVSASPTQIDLAGQSTITIRGFRPDGTPLPPDTQITVTTDLGTIQPFDGVVPGGTSVVEVDRDGVARARLVADGRAGTATVTVSAPGGETSATVLVLIGEDPSTRPTLVMNANPSTIPVLSTSLISILGRNSDGTAVAEDQRIRLTADLGDLKCGNAPCSEVLTDENGEAEVTFVAGDRGGTGFVRAILGSSDEASVEINIRDAVASIFLSADVQSIQRVETGTNVNLLALLQNAQGEPVSGSSVLFESERGTLSDNRVVSNAQGESTSILTVTADDVRSIEENGTFEVKATVTSEGVTRVDTLDITVLGAP